MARNLNLFYYVNQIAILAVAVLFSQCLLEFEVIIGVK